MQRCWEIYILNALGRDDQHKGGTDVTTWVCQSSDVFTKREMEESQHEETLEKLNVIYVTQRISIRYVKTEKSFLSNYVQY